MTSLFTSLTLTLLPDAKRFRWLLKPSNMSQSDSSAIELLNVSSADPPYKDLFQYDSACLTPETDPSICNGVDDMVYLPASTVDAKYEFRLGPRLANSIQLGSWVDQDGSGNYDPNAKFDPAVQPLPEIPAGRKREREREGRTNVDMYREYQDKRPRRMTWRSGRLNGKRLPVTLSFKSRKSLAMLRKFGSSLDHWPSSAIVPDDSGGAWKSWWNAEPKCFGAHYQEPSGRVRTCADKSKASPLMHLSSGTGPRSEDVMIGHPAARGCKPCLVLNQRCALLDEGERYPCKACTEDGLDCDLVIEPAKKGTCLACRKRRVTCSYRTQEDHQGPCENCNNKGFKCVAGPASGRTRSGPSLDSPCPVKRNPSRRSTGRSAYSQQLKAQDPCQAQIAAPKHAHHQTNIESYFSPISKGTLTFDQLLQVLGTT